MRQTNRAGFSELDLAYSVEKLCHEKIASEIWEIILIIGQLANLVSERVSSRENILLIRPVGTRR
jgi:hypothetical protein